MSVALIPKGHRGPDSEILLKFDDKILHRYVTEGKNVIIRLAGFNQQCDKFLFVHVQPIDRPWVEGSGQFRITQREPTAPNGQVTWVNRPPIVEGAELNQQIFWDLSDAPISYYTLNITDVVKAWMNGLPNHGIRIKPPHYVRWFLGEGNQAASGFFFGTSEHPNCLVRPKLFIASTNFPKFPVPENLVANGSFEDATPGNNNANIPCWTVERAPDVVASWKSADGKNSLDMGASPGAARLTQMLLTKPGTLYELSFQVAVNPGGCDHSFFVPREYVEKPILVRVGSQYKRYDLDCRFRSYEDMKWKKETIRFIALDPITKLEFEMPNEQEIFYGPYYQGVALDDVKVRAIRP